jgi:hypothetical protein
VNLETLPTTVAKRITETPGHCEECRKAGKAAWAERYYKWYCAEHALKKMVYLRALAKRRAAFRPPLRKLKRDQAT